MIKRIYLFLFLLNCLDISAQISIKGKIIDEQNNSLPYANIVLLSLPDSTFISGTISAEDGTFSLPLASQNQLLRISSIGYTTVYKAIESSDLGIIQLVSDTQQLDEVIVQGTLPVTRIKGDAMITGVSGTVLEKAGTTEQLLDKIPNVSSKDGEINVFGRGTPEIYIDGRKLHDQTELDRLSADQVKAVEVINNPGARYGAEVTAVIRITTRKTEGEGFGFNNRTMAQYKKDWSFLEQFNFNYREGGLDISGMLYGSKSYGWIQKGIIQNTYVQEHWIQDSHLFNDWKSKNFEAQLALNYTFNENNSLGVRYDYHKTPYSKSLMDMQTQVYRNEVPSEYTSSPDHIRNENDYHQVNAYYMGKTGEWNIDLNLDGYWETSEKDSKLEELTGYPDGTEHLRPVSTFSDINNTLYAARLIFTHPLWDGELSFGGEYTYTNRENKFLNPEEIISDDNSRIRENMGSAFIEYGKSFGKVQAQVGLRYEHNASTYYEEGTRIAEQSKNYDNVFPALSISFPIRHFNFQLAYRTDIARPSYWDLRSNILYTNKYTYETGNPLLKPKLTHSATLGVTYRWIQFSAGYSRVKDDIINVTGLYEEDDPTIMLMSLANAPAYDKLFSGLTLSPTIGFWSPQWRFQLTKQWYTAQTPQGNRKMNNPMGIIVWKNNLRLPWGFILDIDFSYMTKGDIKNGHFFKPSWQTDVSLQKGFLNEQLNIRLDALNIFDSYQRDFMMYVSNRQTIHMKEVSTHCTARLTISYKFNATKSKYKGSRAGQEQLNRM